MQSIREIIDDLKPEEHKQLMYAFENGFEQYIKLPGDKFIGVNIINFKHLEILQSSGQWSFGIIKDVIQ
jgi:hypothetical protein